MRCLTVCSDSSGQEQSGVGTFFILWRYVRKQLWFVSSCVREWFGQRDRAILWGMEGMICLVWEAFAELT